MSKRRDHQCHCDGCDSPASWQLWLQMECIAKDGGRIRLQSESTIRLCNKPAHHAKALRFLLSERNKAAIAAGLKSNGFPPPDFSSATPLMVPLAATALVEGAPGDLRALAHG